MTRKKNPSSGFTLIELIIAIGFFGFISALLMNNLFAIYNVKEVIRFNKDINFEASAVLGNTVAGLIRSGFAIRYPDTVTSVSQQPSEGMKTDTDKISVYTDRAETQYFTIYREAYRSTGDDGDTARLMLSFSNGDTFPLHTSETVVEDFDVEVPKDPRNGGDPDQQPYVSLYLRVRHRNPFHETPDESKEMAYQKVRASYRTTYTLRNTLPSSYKTL